MELKLYGSYISPPFRAVLSLLTIETPNIKSEWKPIFLKMGKLENKTQSYLKISPAGKIPALQVTHPDHPDQNIIESHTILKYICLQNNLPDHWYPTSASRDIKLQARMDMYLDWHHAGIRMGSSGYVVNKYFKPHATEEMIDESENIVRRSL